MRHPIFPKDSTFGPFPSPGLNGTVVVWDDSRATQGRPGKASDIKHIVVAFLFDQAVTVIAKWAPSMDAPDSALKVINGAVSGGVHVGVPTTANTFYSGDFILQPGRNQISIVATTAPTATYIAVEKITFDGTIS